MHANLSVSEGLRKWLSEYDGLDTQTNFSVLFNGADPERLKPSGHSVRGALGFDEDAFVFGMVANFYVDPRKDQLTICRALPAVFEKLPNAQFIFAGGIEPGAEDKMADCLNVCIENRIANRVHFLFLVRAGTCPTSRRARCLCFFVVQEGFRWPHRSDACRCSIDRLRYRSPSRGNCKWRVRKVFPVGDDKKLAELMIELGSNKEKSHELGSRAKAFADENFSIDAHLRSLAQIYAGLLKK